ncbi:MAG: VWA domain-containing protein [Betaproteobacteria bacterium]
MEEWIGGLWHRWITRSAGGHYPEQAVYLSDMEQHIGVLYRAFGGDPGRRLGGAAFDRHHGRRRWLSRLAGSDQRVALTSLEETTLRLPSCLDCFPERRLNRELYLWLAALAASDVEPTADWLTRNQRAAQTALTRFPGLAPSYRRLVSAHLAQRLAPEELPVAEAAQERAIRAALQNPDACCQAPDPGHKPPPPQPVLLWLSPHSIQPPTISEDTSPASTRDSSDNGAKVTDDEHALRAERVALPQPKSPFILMFRAESLLSWGEYLHINRALDDDPDPHAKDAARDLDHLSLARGGAPTRSKVKFDLDLPSEAADDLRLGEGIALPEWDYRSNTLQPGHVRLQPMQARSAPPVPLPPHLAPAARRLRNRFAALVDVRRWRRGQNDGDEIDLDASLRYFTERRSGQVSDDGLYCSSQPQDRNLACLLLADLSMSTDSWVSNEHRVIDVVRDTAFLFCEALSATGDRFGVYGFSSVRRSHVRFHVVKDFSSAYDASARGRIAALKPGYYTRIGAALRQATRILAEQPAKRRLLLLLSDGKPNDLDEYDSRYGIEDTRMAIMEARRLGIVPFCVTIDREGGDYLPHLFGRSGFQVITHPEELPARLPKLYAELSKA